jgi:hypothetical protein
MAARIGVARTWWQDPETMKNVSTSHYDIAQSKKALAVAAGAVAIEYRQAGAMSARRRVTGSLGSPAEAVQWLREHNAERRRARGLPPLSGPAAEPDVAVIPSKDAQACLEF